MASKSFQIDTEIFSVKAVTDDDLVKLFVDIEIQSRKQAFTAAMLEAELAKHVSQDLLDQGVLKDVEKILQNNTKIERRRVSKGQLPKKGIDGKLVFMKRKLSRDPNIQKSDDAGTVSMKDLGLFENIACGEPVARIYPPKMGEAGIDVFGNEIPSSSGEAVQVQIDQETLEIVPGEKDGLNYDRIVAKVDGYLEVQGPKLIMREEFVVPRNLDGEFGSIAFIGSVTVKGDVLAGFRVSGDKGVTVGGNVNKTEIVSVGGPIHIKGRFFGEGKGKLVSPKTIRVHAIQDGTIDSSSDVFIEKEARASVIRTRATLQAEAATILGGKAFAVLGARIGNLGTENQIATDLLLGNDIEATEEYQLLITRIREHEKGLELIDAHLGPYAKAPDRIQLLKKELQTKLQALLTKKEKVLKSLQSLCEKREELLGSATIQDRELITIEKTMHPGARIQVKETFYAVKEPLKGPTTICYDYSTEEFSIIDYQQILPSEEEAK